MPKGYSNTPLESYKKRSLSLTGQKRTEEVKERMRLASKHIKWSPATREKMKNRIPWNKGKKGLQTHSEEWKRQNSERMKGNQHTKGFKYSEEVRKTFGSPGEKHPNYKGGLPNCQLCSEQLTSYKVKICRECRSKNAISPINTLIRQSIEYRLWRESVFVRDNFTDQKTGIKGGELVAHHILNFASNIELRFAIDNGITLSKKSHAEFHRRYGKKNNAREQLDEFLKSKY